MIRSPHLPPFFRAAAPTIDFGQFAGMHVRVSTIGIVHDSNAVYMFHRHMEAPKGACMMRHLDTDTI
jgi:hypothetical protein